MSQERYGVEVSTGVPSSIPQTAYEAYAKHQQWKNFQGQPIPPWHAVREDIKQAWVAAISAAFDVFLNYGSK